MKVVDPGYRVLRAQSSDAPNAIESRIYDKTVISRECFELLLA